VKKQTGLSIKRHEQEAKTGTREKLNETETERNRQDNYKACPSESGTEVGAP
jgi:hypothetical protein